MDLLFAWFTAGFLAILTLLSLAETRPRTKPLVNLLALLVAIGWYFVPVALQHP